MTNSDYKSLMTSVYAKLHNNVSHQNSGMSIWSMTLEELLAVNFSTAPSATALKNTYQINETKNKLSIHV